MFRIIPESYSTGEGSDTGDNDCAQDDDVEAFLYFHQNMSLKGLIEQIGH